MNKIISFSNEDRSKNELQIRLIVCNIVEYCCTKDNIIIDDIMYCFKNYENICIDTSYSIEDSDTLVMCNTLQLPSVKDIDKFSEYLYVTYKPLKDNFIKSLNMYDDLNICEFIISILHEIGHVVQMAYHFNRSNDIEDIARFKISINQIRQSINLLYPVINNVEQECYNYYYQPTEALAWEYAYSNYYEIMNMLKFRGLL